MEVAFGEWLADARDYKNPGLEEVENATPGVNGFSPAREFVSSGVAVAGTIIGAGSSYLVDGSTAVFVATTDDLHILRGGVSMASGLSLALPDTSTVVFEQFNNAIYATSKDGGMWVLSDFELGTAFVDNTGSPPTANAMGRVADFLIMGDLTDIDASNAPYRIRWSRFNNPGGSWTTDIGAQSGAIDLDAKYGPVTAITGGNYGLIFQRQGVTRISFTGGATVFRLDPFEENRGCVSPASAVQVGEVIYYLAHDGFFRTDGTTPQAISTGKIWSWFSGEVNESYLNKVTGSVDYQRRCVVWLFSGAVGADYTGQLWYNWETESWGYVSQPMQWVISGSKSGLSLEEVGALYPDLDAMPVSLDSPDFQPTGRNLQAFSSGSLGELTGTTLKATFTTGDMQPFPSQRAFVDEITPLVEADAVNVRLGCKDRMTQTFTDSSTVPMGTIGFAPFNHDARYFRVTVEIPAGEEWGNAHGFQIAAQPAGRL